MKDELMNTMNVKFQSLKDEFALDVARIDNRLDSVELKLSRVASNPVRTQAFDTDRTVVAIGLPYNTSENLDQKVGDLIQALKANPAPDATDHLEQAEVVNILRMPVRHDGKHPIVKIEFKSKDNKIAILRKKGVPKNIYAFKKVFLRTSKTHTERLMEINVNTLMNLIPNVKDKFHFSGSGRLIPKPPQNAWLNRNQDGGAAAQSS
jgi:hypothetical protein